MAKKKSETGSTDKKQTAPAAKKPATPGAPKAAPKPAAAPAIDTSLAANAAAAMIGNKAAGAGTAPAGAGGQTQPPQKKESAAFKQLKAGLNKPAGGALGGAFGVGAKQPKKTAQNYGGGKQVGHNQTFGSDVNRASVPRRTPG